VPFSTREVPDGEFEPPHYVQRVHLPGLERYAVRGEPLPRTEEPLPAVDVVDAVS
jgi:hypothetical protein